MRQHNEHYHREVGTQSSEGYTLLMNRLTERNGSAPGAIFCHGATADHASVVFHPPAVELARRGFIVMGIDAGGVHTWGNDASLAKVTSARTWLQSTGLAAPGPVILLGGSMGSIVALNWARANPTLVYCLELALPIVNVENVRAADRLGFASDIEAAYGGLTAWNNARPTHDPVSYANQLDDIPIRLDSSLTDTVGLPAETEAFASIVSLADVVYFGSSGHTYTGFSGVDSVDWIESVL